LIGDWINDYFSLSDDHTIDSNHETIKIYSFNHGNRSNLLPGFDLSYVYLHWNLDSINYVSEINKERQFDLMKLGNIHMDVNGSL
jgi:hypothetical protein